MVRPRGTTDAELNSSLTRILASVEARVDPDCQRMFRCAGGCEDTGWVVTDDGLVGGKRVRAAKVRKCGKCGGESSRRATEVTGGSFT